MFPSGELANKIGPTALFQERVKNADERLLVAGKFTLFLLVPRGIHRQQHHATHLYPKRNWFPSKLSAPFSTGLIVAIGPCMCVFRCVRNGCQMKVNNKSFDKQRRVPFVFLSFFQKHWFYPRSLSTYRQRRETERGKFNESNLPILLCVLGRIMTLDRLMALSAAIYSSA